MSVVLVVVLLPVGDADLGVEQADLHRVHRTMKPQQPLEVIIASWPEEPELVAEIWSGSEYVADVRRRQNGLVVSLGRATGDATEVRLSSLQDALTVAQRRLG